MKGNHSFYYKCSHYLENLATFQRSSYIGGNFTPIMKFIIILFFFHKFVYNQQNNVFDKKTLFVILQRNHHV